MSPGDAKEVIEQIALDPSLHPGWKALGITVISSLALLTGLLAVVIRRMFTYQKEEMDEIRKDMREVLALVREVLKDVLRSKNH